MKIVIAALITACFCASVHAETSTNKWIRRTAGYVACGLSAFDGYQTINNVGRDGITETNFIFGKHPSIAKVSIIKAAGCLIPAVAVEFTPKNSIARPFNEGLSLGAVALFSWVTVHNHEVVDRAEARTQAAMASGILAQ